MRLRRCWSRITGMTNDSAAETVTTTATTAVTTTAMMVANQANWDARTPIHVNSDFYRLADRDPNSWLADFERADIGPVTGLDILHTQCHLGTETTAFALDGARVVGLDFSAEAVAAAQRYARERGADVEYLQSNVYDARAALNGRTFDLIYTGKGSLCWLPDLASWARVMANSLRPGGRLYLCEFHPLVTAFADPREHDTDPGLRLDYDYLAGRGAQEFSGGFTYTDGPELAGPRTTYEWAHGLGDVINSIIDAGLVVDHVREYDRSVWKSLPTMVSAGDGWWRLPDSAPRLPLLYTVAAHAPAG